jgi:hypothetical protein
LFFKNAGDEKQHSSFTLLRTWTMAIFANLRYLGKECVKMYDALIVLQMQVSGLRSNGGSMAALELLFIQSLNIPCSTSSY